MVLVRAVSEAIARRRRESELAFELPDALDRLAADLRGGATVLGGLEVLARGDGPLAGEVRLVVRRVAAGMPLSGSLAAWPAGRPEIGVAAGALEIAAAVGGRSAPALEGLAAGLRDRRRLGEEVLALSAQARLSAVVVGLAPVGSLALSLVVDPRVPGALFGTAPGRVCLLAGAALEIAAALWMRRILRAGRP